MKIRLIIPLCRNKNGYYCEDSKNINERINIIKLAIKRNFNGNNTLPDLIVTSNNFFSFDIFSKNIHIKNFIESKIIKKINSIINNTKIPIVLGFDLFKANKIYTKKKHSNTFYNKFNPYNGINAVVTYLNVNKNSFYKYEYGTHIWECWYGSRKCDKHCFFQQNKKRIITLKKKKIILMSCGDIAKECHNYDFPKGDLILNLSHMSVKGDSPQYKQQKKIVNKNLTNHIFCTQQVSTNNTLRKYIKENYSCIYPHSLKSSINKYNEKVNSGVFIDIEIN